MNRRRIAVAVLAADVVALVVAGGMAATRPDVPPPDPARLVRVTCIAGEVVESFDDGSPAGWLPISTGRSCDEGL